MDRIWRRSLQLTAALTVAAGGFAACSERGPATEETAQGSAAITAAAVGAPCAARAEAVIANTGNVASNAGSLVDSYQSSQGAYGGGNVGNNGTVQAGGSVARSGGTIHGSITPNSAAHLAVVPVPPGATPLPLGSQTPGNLNINGPSDSITIAPGNYVVANVNVNFQGAINISPPGPVSIFVTENLNLGGNENLSGSPANLEFLVTSSAVVNVNSRGTLVGLIYAPIAPVNVNSTVFGSVVGSSLALNSGSAVHFDQSSVCPPPPPSTPPIPPTPLPAPPPPVIGCYVNTASGWQSVPCATDAAIKAHFPHPQFLNTLESTAQQVPLVFGQIETTFPAVGTLTDTFVNTGVDVCPTTGPSTPNIWSVQNNTNVFMGPTGHRSAVQFAIQSDGNTDGVCIWNVDVTAQLYPTSCYMPPPTQRAGGLQAFDSANLAASVDAATKTLTLVAQLSWVTAGEPNQFAVVAPDLNGLAGNWFEETGSVLGFGDCSQAVFTNTELYTQLMVSSCPGDTQASSPVCPSPRLQPNVLLTTLGPSMDGGPPNANGGTAESNNLIQVGGPGAVTYLNPDLAVTNYRSTTTGGCLGPSHVYLKDNDNDFGATPSNVGNQVYWESPDIFLVPRGSTVNSTSISSETVITPGGLFDIWVRVHNDLGCTQATGVKALVFLADPSALSAEWGPISNGQYVGNGGGTAGITIPAGSESLIGPIPFTAPSTNLGDGHRCILAAIEGDTEAAVSTAATFDAPDSNQVAQRNIQFTACAYPLTNATTSNGNVQVTLTVSPPAVKPSLSGTPDAVSVTFDDADSSWFGVWSVQAGNGSTFAVSHASNGTTTVKLGTNSVALNAVPLGAGQSRTASGTVNLATGDPTATLRVQGTLTDAANDPPVMNGGSCVIQPPPVIQ